MRRILYLYRRLQYFLCRRHRYGVLSDGVEVKVEPFQYEINHGDVVHPCVRYIPECYEGHCWWLVYTPYYGADPSMENPILCYSDSIGLDPPIEWKVYCEVKGKPERGYNSDPVLLFTKGKLFVFWREYATESIEEFGHKVGTFGGVVKDGHIEKVFGPVVWSNDAEVDQEVSPTFFQKGDKYVCYAMHLKFHSKWLKQQRPIVKKVLSSFLAVSDLFGFGGQQKSYGIARWESDDVEHPFRYLDTVSFRNCNALYRPWHMDFFEYKNRLYAIVQTNQSNADICLAESDNGITFTLFRKPLITNATIKKVGLYKPTAGVTSKGVFYLYYTAQDTHCRRLNKLFLVQKEFAELLAELLR